MSQGPVAVVPPESGVPLAPELPELLPELALPELLPELALPELLPELALPELPPELALPELPPELVLPELLSELALPELPPDPSLLLDAEVLSAPESDSSCPPLASGTECDGPTSEPQEQKVAIAAGKAISEPRPHTASIDTSNPAAGRRSLCMSPG
jgi:hypothetical protein